MASVPTPPAPPEMNTRAPTANRLGPPLRLPPPRRRAHYLPPMAGRDATPPAPYLDERCSPPGSARGRPRNASTHSPARPAHHLSSAGMHVHTDYIKPLC